MIFEIDSSFIDAHAQNKVSDILSEIVVNGHYIQAEKDVIRMLKQSIEIHGSTTQKELFKARTDLFDIPSTLFKYLRIFKVVDTIPLSLLSELITTSSRLIVENANHEWVVYKYFIDLYKTDTKYGDVFKLIVKAKEKNRITGVHAGGAGELIKVTNNNPIVHNGHNLRLLKTCVLFDRDTDNDTYYDSNKDPLFKEFVGKDHSSITLTDIYTLDHEMPVWHMWYKRAIENYFSPERYQSVGFNITPFYGLTQTEIDYKMIGGKANQNPLIPSYKKNSLSRLIVGLSRNELENILKKFQINGVDMSEIQLFLLKLAKIL